MKDASASLTWTRRRILLAGVFGPSVPHVLAGGWADSPGPALTHWSHQQLRLVVKHQQNPLRAARAMAYLHVALQEGWRLGAPHSPAVGLASAHNVAAQLMERLYPHETPGQFRAQAAALSLSSGASTIERRLAEREAVGMARPLLTRCLRDGAGRVWAPSMRPAPFDGIWVPSPPLNQVNPAEGMAPFWRTWLPTERHVYDPPQAPRPGQTRYRPEMLEVLDVARRLQPHEAALARHWHLDAGSVTPPGLWMRMALDALPPWSSTMDVGAMLDTLALLATTMHDALVHCWKVKLRDWSERPVTAIRRTLDPAFTPLLVTPGFPAYVSGHACASGAAAEVLTKRLAQTGAVDHWQVKAEEAASSRLWGGIHFRSDNEEGLKLGRSVGLATLANFDEGGLRARDSGGAQVR